MPRFTITVRVRRTEVYSLEAESLEEARAQAYYGNLGEYMGTDLEPYDDALVLSVKEEG